MLRHPKRSLIVGVIVVALLSIFGFSLEERLNPSTIEISGTKTSHATEMLNEYFGDSAPFVIFLQGPPKALDEQGPELIRTLRRDPKVTTLSPWDRGAVSRLRPGPRHAFILLDFHVGNHEAVDDKVPLLNEVLEKTIHAPVRGTQTGVATLSRAIEEGSISATERAELIALPVLLIVLLLVFRSPVAAGVPLAFGALSVLSSRGLLAVLTNFFDVSALALTVCSMLGLALGVDYALLMVSRFREELAEGADPVTAAWTTRRTAARTVVFAAATLVLSMLVALFVVPGALLASLAGTLAMVVTLTALIATLLGPSVLVLIGTNIDRWRIGAAPNGERSRLMRVVSAALRRPAPVAIAIGAVVLLLAAPALALKTGPFSIGQLPKDDPAREDAELIEESAGGGLEAPFVMVAVSPKRPITEEDTLDALDRWQTRLAHTPGVQSVIGPSQLTSAGQAPAERPFGPARLQQPGRSAGQPRSVGDEHRTSCERSWRPPQRALAVHRRRSVAGRRLRPGRRGLDPARRGSGPGRLGRAGSLRRNPSDRHWEQGTRERERKGGPGCPSAQVRDP